MGVRAGDDVGSLKYEKLAVSKILGGEGDWISEQETVRVWVEGRDRKESCYQLSALSSQ